MDNLARTFNALGHLPFEQNCSGHDSTILDYWLELYVIALEDERKEC